MDPAQVEGRILRRIRVFHNLYAIRSASTFSRRFIFPGARIRKAPYFPSWWMERRGGDALDPTFVEQEDPLPLPGAVSIYAPTAPGRRFNRTV